jgi:hypothetical protein
MLLRDRMLMSDTKDGAYEFHTPMGKKFMRLGEMRSLMTVLRVRGIDVPGSIRDRISNETDSAQLHRWLARAVVASLLEDVFTDPS